MTPLQLGPWILATWMHLATCVGVVPADGPPRVVIGRGASVPCPAFAGKCYDAQCSQTYDGDCAGVHKGRTIFVGYQTTGALPHELLHDVLRQTRWGADRKHAAPFWKTCLDEKGEPR